ncbi:MAG: hypothetical protein A2V77_19475 [Anaeromyxobacter sp. RBG_16_69_14]|nr:MAG: hypothetical protein A2V77_19475 [Anaeromyxobacter sp. RBG_16_69_14]
MHDLYRWCPTLPVQYRPPESSKNMQDQATAANLNQRRILCIASDSRISSAKRPSVGSLSSGSRALCGPRLLPAWGATSPLGRDSVLHGAREVPGEDGLGRKLLAIFPTGAGKSLCYEFGEALGEVQAATASRIGPSGAVLAAPGGAGGLRPVSRADGSAG